MIPDVLLEDKGEQLVILTEILPFQPLYPIPEVYPSPGEMQASVINSLQK